MDPYIPKRLIDTNILIQLMKKNPILEKANTRLIAFDAPLPKPSNIISSATKIEKKIEKLKDNIMYEMTPSIINGLVFVVICLLIYFILYYKYNKKKNQLMKR